MATIEREWVPVREAAQEVGVSVTTVRDWYRSGVIETEEYASRKMVRLAQVREQAVALAGKVRPALQTRIADRPRPAENDPGRESEPKESVLELQQIARRRLEA